MARNGGILPLAALRMAKAEPFPLPHEWFPSEWFAEARAEDIFPAGARPLELDLGCGDGSFLLRMAERFPERDFLGVERLLGRIRKVSRGAAREGLANVRVLRADSNYATRWLLPKGAFSRIHFLCPDPWPKKKHARRRQMCQPSFLAALHGLLGEDGELLFMTDAEAYCAEVCEVLPGIPFFERLPWEPDDFFYPKTDFEEQWLAEGRSMHRLRLRAGRRAAA